MLRGLENLIAAGAQLGRLRSAMETSPWSDCVKSSMMSMLHCLRAWWAQERSASSEDGTFCLEKNELRISCMSDVVPCFVICRRHKEGKMQHGGIERADGWRWTADRA